MNRRDEHWGQEDDPIVQRLRDEKPQASPLELDRMKTAAMAKAKPSRSRGASSRSRILTGLLTVGVMAGGTAGTVAATSGSPSSVGAARVEYKHCEFAGGKRDKERCRRLYCAKKFAGKRRDQERCLREFGLVPFPPGNPSGGPSPVPTGAVGTPTIKPVVQAPVAKAPVAKKAVVVKKAAAKKAVKKAVHKKAVKKAVKKKHVARHAKLSRH